MGELESSGSSGARPPASPDASTAPDADSELAAEMRDAAVSGDTLTPDGQADAAAGQMRDAAMSDARTDATALQAQDATASTSMDSGNPPPDTGVDAATSGSLCASCGGCEEKQPTRSGIHTQEPVSYPDPPPTSGAHNPCWASWGVHDTPIAPERWVHNLEHGGVVFLYNCPQGCAADVDNLKLLVSTHQRTVLTAYDQLPKRFAVVSWGHRLVTDCVDETAFADFYASNFDHATESNGDDPVGCPP